MSIAQNARAIFHIIIRTWYYAETYYNGWTRVDDTWMAVEGGSKCLIVKCDQTDESDLGTNVKK